MLGVAGDTLNRFYKLVEQEQSLSMVKIIANIKKYVKSHDLSIACNIYTINIIRTFAGQQRILDNNKLLYEEVPAGNIIQPVAQNTQRKPPEACEY